MDFLDMEASLSAQVAAGLLQIRAVEIRPDQPFTWSSGWKSPIYCDNRLVLSFPVLRQMVVKGLCAAVERYFPGLEVLAGTSTAGIPHAALIAGELGLPMVYVRNSAKSHGKGRQIEGLVHGGSRVVVVEDTVSTGLSAFSAVTAMQEEGAQVLGVLSIFSYDFDITLQRAREFQVPVCRLLDYQRLMDTATNQGYITTDDKVRLMEWWRNPAHY